MLKIDDFEDFGKFTEEAMKGFMCGTIDGSKGPHRLWMEVGVTTDKDGKQHSGSGIEVTLKDELTPGQFARTLGNLLTTHYMKIKYGMEEYYRIFTKPLLDTEGNFEGE